VSANRAGGKVFPLACFPSRGAARGRRRTTLPGGRGWAKTAVGAASRTRGRSRDQAQVVRRRQARLGSPHHHCVVHVHSVVQQRTANASSASDSTPTVASVRKPVSAARQEACFRSADFPMPGSPRKTTASPVWQAIEDGVQALHLPSPSDQLNTRIAPARFAHPNHSHPAAPDPTPQRGA
jgi:hypothetical protein